MNFLVVTPPSIDQNITEQRKTITVTPQLLLHDSPSSLYPSWSSPSWSASAAPYSNKYCSTIVWCQSPSRTRLSLTFPFHDSTPNSFLLWASLPPILDTLQLLSLISLFVSIMNTRAVGSSKSRCDGALFQYRAIKVETRTGIINI